MSELIEYKCPNCSGAIKFDSTSQKMKCKYCDDEFTVDELEKLNDTQDNDNETEWTKINDNEWDKNDKENMSTYICNSCGGEIIGDKNTSATKCPYCDNPVVISQNLSGSLKPDYIIPFKIDKNDAKQELLNHLKGKHFLPKPFKDENHIDKIRGIYVPFWLYDANADAKIRYSGTRTYRWSNSDYDYKRVDYHSIYREGSVDFENVPVDGSSKMPNDLMESIEPYDFSEAVDFKTAYLAGYVADKYDVDAKDNETNANKRIKKSTEDIIKSTVYGYDSLTVKSSKIKLSNGKVKYVLYPVWILNTTYRGKKHTFAMNGQTGKFVGDLPCNKKSFWLWTFLLTIPSSVVTYLLMWVWGI